MFSLTAMKHDAWNEQKFVDSREKYDRVVDLHDRASDQVDGAGKRWRRKIG
jgi:hypothetical protein